MTMREATVADVDALVAMGMLFLESVYRGLIIGNAAALRATALGLIASADAVIYVAESHGVAVGMMGMMVYAHPMSGTRTASEVMWWMDPARRGAGVRLFRLGEAWARDRGATIVQMIAPTPDVERFYAHAGYVPVERTFQKRLT